MEQMSNVVAGLAAGLTYLAGSVLVFVFGSSYYSLFKTNTSWIFRVLLVAASAALTWVLIRSDLNPAAGRLAYAFLAASTASVLGAAGARLQKPFRMDGDTVPGMAKSKALEAFIVVASILLLAWIVGVPLSALYFRAGSFWLGLGVGVVGFALFALLAISQGNQLGVKPEMIRRLWPWILVFVFANAFMEELWFRAIFFGPLTSLVGPIAAVALTAVVFAVVHIGATYMSKQERVRFLVILFVLGLAWGACLHFTGSILASTLFHAGADLMIINGFIAAIYGKKDGNAEESGPTIGLA